MRIWRCFSCSAASASEEEEGGGNMRIWCCSIRSSFMLMSSFEIRLGTGPATQGYIYTCIWVHIHWHANTSSREQRSHHSPSPLF